MHIAITGPEGLTTDQVRGYAEYRVFASLARFGRAIRTASVHLEPRAGAGSRVTCSIDVDLGGVEPIRCHSTEAHVIGAIDAAADRARRALERREKEQAVSF